MPNRQMSFYIFAACIYMVTAFVSESSLGYATSCFWYRLSSLFYHHYILCFCIWCVL